MRIYKKVIYNSLKITLTWIDYKDNNHVSKPYKKVRIRSGGPHEG